MPFIDDESLTKVLAFVKTASGVEMTPEKAYLAEFRLRPIAKAQNMEDLSQLWKRLGDPKELVLRQQVIDAMTTHETLFFRDPAVFARIKKILEALVVAKNAAGGKRRLRVWSAACSTGQEAYSIAILLRETIPDLDDWDARILGTDIAAEPLETCESGLYPLLHINRGLPVSYLVKYFTQEPTGWRVKPALKKLATFRKESLFGEVPIGAPFDIVLCRNVLIYFSDADSKAVLARMRLALMTGGHLILGGSENLLGREAGFSAGVDGLPSVYKAV
jgi:chemotaxis protein methyltransferase CheR